MTQPRIVHLESLDALRNAAAAWDDLWRRSEAALPSLRAELLAQWVEQFARPGDFHAVAVEQQGRLVAALPLVRRRLGRVLNVAAMPCNEWSASGELLLDATAFASHGGVPLLDASQAVPAGTPRHCFCEAVAHRATDPVLDAMAAAVRELPWPLLWLDEAVLDAPRWQGLQQAFVQAGMTVAEHPRWQVGRVAIDHDWPAYKARWSRKHRRQMAQAARQLAQRGEVRLVVHSRGVPLLSASQAVDAGADGHCFCEAVAHCDLAAAMQQCFEIEDRSWKGAAGGAVLRTPDMAEFFIRQAQQAAQWGQLDLAVLHCGGRPVAFSYGLSAKGVFHSLKTGYDPDFARQHPGQLLRYYLLEQLFADPARKALDFLGPMTESHAAWLPHCYTIGRLAVAPRGGLGRLAVWGYKNVWPRYHRIARENIPGSHAPRGNPPSPTLRVDE